jgi:23S rRNA pseudouridine2605 synthase
VRRGSAPEPAGTEKLQKVLARKGLGSRRELEGWIADGRVSVNGAVVSLGARVGGRDVVRLDGRVVDIRRRDQRPRVLMLHKAVGVVCARHDSDGRPTVFEGLPRVNAGRWILVGRLDLNTSGLLLLTDSGELAHRLMHPSTEIEREYAVRVRGEVGRRVLDALASGVELEDGVARFDSIRPAGGSGVNHWYHVVLREGRNREVRRLWESQGVMVSRLTRVRYGPVRLPRWLRPGRFEALAARDVDALLSAAGLGSLPTPAARGAVRTGRGGRRGDTRARGRPRA